MLKKLLWFILIIIILYIVFIFVLPEVSDKIWEKIWTLPFHQKVRDLKVKFDEIYTNLPSQEEVKEFYDKTKSWAIDQANNIKDKVDDVRQNLNEAKDKYDETVEKINETKDKIEWWLEIIKSFSWVLNTETGTTIQE